MSNQGNSTESAFFGGAVYCCSHAQVNQQYVACEPPGRSQNIASWRPFHRY